MRDAAGFLISQAMATFALYQLVGNLCRYPVGPGLIGIITLCVRKSRTRRRKK